MTSNGRDRPRQRKNLLNTSKVECYGRCLRNQQTEARIALVSHSRTIKRLDSRPDRFKQS